MSCLITAAQPIIATHLALTPRAPHIAAQTFPAEKYVGFGAPRYRRYRARFWCFPDLVLVQDDDDELVAKSKDSGAGHVDVECMRVGGAS